MQKVFSYIKYLIRSTNQHGIHSPFVYDLTTKCFYKKPDSFNKKALKAHRFSILSNKSKIEITDFGAGSKVFKSDLRAIYKIAKYAGITSNRALLLSCITAYFQPKTVLEFGTSLGIGTAALHIGNPNAQITTLEGCKNTAEIAQKQFDEFSFKNIEVITGEFTKTLSTLKFENSLDMVYFDGNHQKEATLKYFHHCLQFIHNESFFIFDDIHWSKEMESAWLAIKKHPKVKVTIDTFQWGIVFFRKEQEKEHFIIRV
ncbi:Protein-L-isoaspartate O-methyltransferase [Polaribacter huanghezhanensis]|uniref:O-methyltransferase n=1 Tax=Polaribacter huanghezhanensis TaxID=1354726 RepID=UPI002648F7CC|nr:class I SAM-dependent methyltransferase [Polaribacter huanghezhanensis]WKD86839.1 Protein-L-isoaspartate O-methyltransferase [Polaribacter huanghezhanensis]